MTNCSICGARAVARALCGKHYQRVHKHGNPFPHKDFAASGSGCTRKDGYRLLTSNGRQRLEHHLIVEKMLGRQLPTGAVIHHVDGNPSNNAADNLVICQDQAYHVLLHKRQAALEACGHADWLRCSICKQYDAVENIRQYGKERKPMHLACNRQLKRDKYQARIR